MPFTFKQIQHILYQLPIGFVIDINITECIDLQVENILANSLYIQADVTHPIFIDLSPSKIGNTSITN